MHCCALSVMTWRHAGWLSWSMPGSDLRKGRSSRRGCVGRTSRELAFGEIGTMFLFWPWFLLFPFINFLKGSWTPKDTACPASCHQLTEKLRISEPAARFQPNSRRRIQWSCAEILFAIIFLLYEVRPRQRLPPSPPLSRLIHKFCRPPLPFLSYVSNNP